MFVVATVDMYVEIAADDDKAADDVGGRVRVTRAEERVLRAGCIRSVSFADCAL